MKNKKIISEYCFITLGSLLFAAGINLFLVPANLYNGGTVGISQIIRTLLNMNNSQFDIAGIINFIINIPLLFLAYFHFGKPLFWGTFFGIATQTIFFSIIKIPVTPIVDEYFVACLMGGILSGVGVGITLKSGGTGGGIDILGLYFTQKFKGFSVGKFALLFNAVVYGVCALLFTLPTAIYSIIFTAIYSLAVDKSYPQNINENITIFTKNPVLYKKIVEELKRGATYWKGTGGYTDTDTYIIITVISKYEFIKLKRVLEQEDPDAFVLVNRQEQIMGNYSLRL